MPSKKPVPVKRPYEDEQRAYNEILQRMQPTRPLFVQPPVKPNGRNPDFNQRPHVDWHARTEWGYNVADSMYNPRVPLIVTVTPQRQGLPPVTPAIALEGAAMAIRKRRMNLLKQGRQSPASDATSGATWFDKEGNFQSYIYKARALNPITGGEGPSALTINNLVGGDPEFFLVDTKGEVVPSGQALGLDSESTVSLGLNPDDGHVGASFPDVTQPGQQVMVDAAGRIYQNYGWVHQDGIQAELGYTPNKCLEYTSLNIVNAFNAMKRSANARGCRMSFKTSVEISPEMAERFPLGCRPSRNAWGNDNFITDKYPTKRFAGGHFHFGLFTPPSIGVTIDAIGPFNLAEYRQLVEESGLTAMPEDFINNNVNHIVKRLDATVGLISVALGRGLDDPERRRYKYGMAGDYRLTDNTLEYRVPSNVLWFHPITWHICAMIGRQIVRTPWDKRKSATVYLNQIDAFIETHEREIVEAIDSTDPDLAVSLLMSPSYTDNVNSLFDYICSGSDASINCNPVPVGNLIKRGSAHYLRNVFAEGWSFTNYTDRNASLSRQHIVPAYY